MEFHFLEITCPQKHSLEKAIGNTAFEVEDKFEKKTRLNQGSQAGNDYNTK